MICRKCGELLNEGTKFCSACGAKVEHEEKDMTVVNPVHTHEENCAHQEEYVRQGHVANPDPVGFLDAVKLFFSHYSDFKGRSRRSEYWWVVLFNAIVGGIIGAISTTLSSIWSLVILVPTLAIIARRLHDVGRSGWFYLWILLPLAGPIIVLIQLLKDSAEDNQWGPNPKH